MRFNSGFKGLIYERKTFRVTPERSTVQTVRPIARLQQTDITQDSSAKLSEHSPMNLLSEDYSDGTRSGTIKRLLVVFSYSCERLCGIMSYQTSGRASGFSISLRIAISSPYLS